jgi:hypothetical protein
MRPRHFLLLLAAIVGCSDLTSPPDVFRAISAEDGVLLENRTSTPVIAVIFEQQTMATIDFALGTSPILDPEKAGAIAPHGWRRVPNAQIFGYHRGATAVVLYSRLVRNPQSGFYDPDSVRFRLIKLP